MISEIVTDMKGLHCVINNAGIGGIGISILDISEDSDSLILSLKDRHYYRDLFLILGNYEISKFNT